jgi:hypothetical protein
VEERRVLRHAVLGEKGICGHTAPSIGDHLEDDPREHTPRGGSLAIPTGRPQALFWEPFRKLASLNRVPTAR